jgi:transcription initiation factor TFIID TATA-box-binding protein
MAELVSAVGGGYLEREVDLHSLYEDVDGVLKEYEPESYPALRLKFKEDGATVMLFRSGKYNIAGAPTVDALLDTNQHLLSTLSGILNCELPDDGDFELRNLVYRDDFGEPVNFQEILAHIDGEYEPESFPSLDYRPEYTEGLVKIFSTGKLTLTGTIDSDSVEETFERVKQEIEESQR